MGCIIHNCAHKWLYTIKRIIQQAALWLGHTIYNPSLLEERQNSSQSLSLMKMSPSSEAASYAATLELPNILCNPKVHCRVHKSPPLVPTLGQINPVHTIPSYLRSILILSTTYVLVFLVVSFLLAFPPITYMHSSSPHSCYMPCPSHPP
jgi:hypothetical protein